jgi:hypothetical protein
VENRLLSARAGALLGWQFEKDVFAEVAVDVRGAEALRRRIMCQQQHGQWRQATSVQDGRAPAADPDLGKLTACEPGLRVYGTGESGRLLVKRLDAGWWREELEEPARRPTAPEAAPLTLRVALPDQTDSRPDVTAARLERRWRPTG